MSKLLKAINKGEGALYKRKSLEETEISDESDDSDAELSGIKVSQKKSSISSNNPVKRKRPSSSSDDPVKRKRTSSSPESLVKRKTSSSSSDSSPVRAKRSNFSHHTKNFSDDSINSTGRNTFL